ncbi:hypothetical protein DYB25_005363 [Aphanomyces astaci]|uniref:Uncharacterized protein n=1 Tax=Aphanomyces astaci TaxID=112090 RepID=A0A397BZW1_APHAT|nr:hypothetical protein DYB25_005363 [Aphanomyces astaci]RHY61147.1 hypothetical protein DYB34_004808 [Aphanomyces astaci]RHY83552.1 hypothetical protein DYB26_003668 [Aphanomyces astaci]
MQVVTATASGDLYSFDAANLSRGSPSTDKRLLVHRVELSSGGLTWATTFWALFWSVFVGSIVAWTGLVYFHVSQAGLLVNHPFQGVEAILASKFESNDAMATVMAGLVGLLATLLSWVLCLNSRALHGVFWIGLALLVLSGVSLWVAATDELHVQWVDGVDLVEYKACIVSAVAGVGFLLLHSIGLMVL